MAHLLGAEAVHLAYPTQVVFEAVTLGVNDGARIGIVGRNATANPVCWACSPVNCGRTPVGSPGVADCG